MSTLDKNNSDSGEANHSPILPAMTESEKKVMDLHIALAQLEAMWDTYPAAQAKQEFIELVRELTVSGEPVELLPTILPTGEKILPKEL